MKATIGVIGLAVMGENLVLNMESHGYTVAVFNRTTSRVDDFKHGRGKGKHIIFTYSLKELVESVASPRIIMMMVKAGSAVDANIDALLPLLDDGDIIIDGGNSNYLDTDRRLKRVEDDHKLYIGCGISGGEEGALHGPSMMAGGSHAAWKVVRPIFDAISAKVGDNFPCCAWIGGGGSGHFVKMVHNGIEYADMQLIAETYDIMKKILRLRPDQMAEIFDAWNTVELNSYLIGITADILRYKLPDGTYLLDKILDVAGQKGTGKLSAITALENDVPLSLVATSVFERYISGEKTEREQASMLFPQKPTAHTPEVEETIRLLRSALYCAKIISYAQGFELMQKMGDSNGWDLNLGQIALIWRGGCIIRSAFLNKIDEAYQDNHALANLVFDPFFASILQEGTPALRKIVSRTVLSGVPCPALSAAVSWFDSYRDNQLPTSLIQAQRDYFGAHTYELIDSERGTFHHTNWTGTGGETTSNAYNV